jgi:PAS domain S-box-containing protein
MLEEREDALRQSRLAGIRHQLVLIYAEDAAIDIDSTGNVISLNPAAERLLKVEGEQALPRALPELVQFVDGPDTLDLLQRCLGGRNESVRIEGEQLRRPDGSGIAVSGIAAPSSPATDARSACCSCCARLRIVRPEGRNTA